MTEPALLEGEAIALYERFGFDPAVPVSAAALALALLGKGSVVRGGFALGEGPAALAWVDGARRIVVRRRLSLEVEQHAVAHELAHVVLGREHGEADELEGACDYLGAALLAPLPAMVELHRRHGLDIAAIAEELVVTQTCAALRLGEAMRVPLAAIGPRIRVRGPEEHVWPGERELRGWAETPPKGLAKVRLTDQRGRVVLVEAG